MSGSQVVLASASPRRRAFMAGAGLRFAVRPAEIDERPVPGEGPVAFARRMAEEKALAGRAARLSSDPETVLASDTGPLAVAYGVPLVPESILIAPTGEVITKLEGGVRMADLEAVIGSWQEANA